MTESNPQGTPAPAPTAPPVPPAAAVAPPPAPSVAPSNEEPPWLPDRLARAKEMERKAVLAELGITDPATAKAALEAARAAEEANKTAAEKAAELAARLTASQSEAERLKSVATEHAARMMAVLTAEQQAAVKAVAGDDPAHQLRAIGALGPTWAKAAAAVAQAAPVSTAPAGNAPPPADPGSPANHQQVYSATRETNPFAAAAYGLTHASDVYKPPA